MTLYHVLGVSPSASARELRQAYYRRARENHPDRGGAGAAMARLNAAWSVLGDPERRRRYDQGLASARERSARPGPAQAMSWAGPLPPDEPEPEGPPVGRHVVMVPVALVTAAVGCFAFSVMAEATALLVASFVLVALAAASFGAAPLLVMRRRRPRRGKGP